MAQKLVIGEDGQPSYVDLTQAEIDQQVVDASNAAVGATASTTEAQRVAAIRANTRRQALVAAILKTDDAGIVQYVNTQVTDLASAKIMLVNLALLVAAQIRT